jgi:hypothetical protein
VSRDIKEAIDSCTIRVLSITITVSNLDPSELDYSRNIGVDYVLYKQRPLAQGRHAC